MKAAEAQVPDERCPQTPIDKPASSLRRNKAEQTSQAARSPLTGFRGCAHWVARKAPVPHLSMKILKRLPPSAP